MARRGLCVVVRLGPFSVGGMVGGRQKPKYQPGKHPMMQPTLLGTFREMRRRRRER